MDKNTQEKKEQRKQFVQDMKIGFEKGIRDKKRWITCLIEIAIAIVLVAIDLITKEYIYGYCVENGRIKIIEGVICFTHVENTGASFGIFSGNTLALTIISIICAVILVLFIFYSYSRRNLWLRSALILILAGAVGNIVDRVVLGYVRDFIYFELIDFAVFNFADSCLTVGTIVLIVYILFFYSQEEKELQKKREAEKAAKLAESAENTSLEEKNENVISDCDDQNDVNLDQSSEVVEKSDDKQSDDNQE